MKKLILIISLLFILLALATLVYKLKFEDKQDSNKIIEKVNSIETTNTKFNKSKLLEIKPCDSPTVKIANLEVNMPNGWYESHADEFGVHEFSKKFSDGLYRIYFQHDHNIAIENNATLEFADNVAFEVDNLVILLHIPNNYEMYTPYNFYRIFYPVGINETTVNVSFIIPSEFEGGGYSIQLRFPELPKNQQFDEAAVVEMISIIKSINWR